VRAGVARRLLAAGAALVAAASTVALAAPERIAFPADYRARFVIFGFVDRLDRQPIPVVRVMYVNPEAAAAARADRPAPEGTVLVMEDREARVDAAGKVVLDAAGRLIPTDKVTGVSVQEKRNGWGAEFPEHLRNGDWDYAVFAPDGSRRPTNTAACLGCHKPRAALDYTFVFQRWVIDGKPR
jgi:hypothetical protein